MPLFSDHHIDEISCARRTLSFLKFSIPLSRRGNSSERPKTEPGDHLEGNYHGTHLVRRHYPPGVPADIDVTQYSSLIELFEESFAKFPKRRNDSSAMGKAITYREFDELSTAFGAYLQSRGLAKGARVAIMMPNVLLNPIASTAALRAGYTVVNVNPLYTARGTWTPA